MRTFEMNLSVKVIPNSSKDEIQVKNDGTFKIKVTKPPADGMANERVIKILSQRFRVPKSSIRIISGRSSSRKIITIETERAKCQN